MVDLKSLLSKPMDEVKAPKALPAGTYTAVVKSQEFGKSPRKKTPFCRYNFAITAAGDDVDHDLLSGVDLSTKSVRYDFYLTENSEFMLKNFLEGLGIKTQGRSMGECIPEAIGNEVVVDVTCRYDEKDSSKVYNDVTGVRPVA